MTTIYNRDAALKIQLNTFLKNQLLLPESDYYSRLNLDGLLQLKAILSGINNSISLSVTMSFAEWVSEFLDSR
jgi:hypothetical protein